MREGKEEHLVVGAPKEENVWETVDKRSMEPLVVFPVGKTVAESPVLSRLAFRPRR